MRYLHHKKNPDFCTTINVEKLWSLISEQQHPKQAETSDKVPVIDTLASGFAKVLAKGRMPEGACVVKARYFSRRAEEKIKAAGGACVLIA
jgi:large subunit ribosomal protein L27Ae